MDPSIRPVTGFYTVPSREWDRKAEVRGFRWGLPWTSAMVFPLVAVLQVCLGGPSNMAVCFRRKHLCLPVTIRLRKSLCPIVTGSSPPSLWHPLYSATRLQIVTLLNCDTFMYVKHPE